MAAPANPKVAAAFGLYLRVASVITIFIPCLVLAGWVLDNDNLKRVLPGFVEMNPVSALNFICIGISLELIRRNSPQGLPAVIGWLLPIFVLSVGAVMECKYVAGFDPGIDRMLFSQSLGPNRMAPNTAACFCMMGAALLSARVKTETGVWAADILATIVGASSLAALVGYAYGVSMIYRIGSFIPMALHTAFCFMVSSLAIITLRPGEGMAVRLTSGGPGGAMLRRSGLAMILTPLGVGWLILAGFRDRYFDAALGFTLFGIVVIIFLAVMIWRNARALDMKEQQRDQADRSLRQSRDELEIRVRERTAELAGMISEIQTGMEVLSGSAAQILELTSAITANAASTRESISDTTVAVAQLRAIVQSASQRAGLVAERAKEAPKVSKAGRDFVAQNIQSIERIKAQMDEVVQSVSTLSDRSLAIAEIVAAVGELADRSNILALNAAIEAAKAREQGAGFAVVAKEVRSLALQSKQFTMTIRRMLDEIRGATSRAASTVAEATEKVTDGVAESKGAGETITLLADSIAEAAQSAVHISTSSREQFVGIDQVARAMEGISGHAADLVTRGKAAEAAAQKLFTLGQKLGDRVKECTR